jgi:hypothetical protein
MIISYPLPVAGRGVCGDRKSRGDCGNFPSGTREVVERPGVRVDFPFRHFTA